MQKNLAEATEALAESLNELHSDKKKGLLELVKKQAFEIEKRGKAILKLESSMEIQQRNIEKLLEQNKHLESMIASMKEERKKLLEESELLKTKKPTRVRGRKKDLKDETSEDSA